MLGFDGEFGYQGPEGREFSLRGLGDAFAYQFTPREPLTVLHMEFAQIALAPETQLAALNFAELPALRTPRAAAPSRAATSAPSDGPANVTMDPELAATIHGAAAFVRGAEAEFARLPADWRSAANFFSLLPGAVSGFFIERAADRDPRLREMLDDLQLVAEYGLEVVHDWDELNVSSGFYTQETSGDLRTLAPYVVAALGAVTPGRQRRESNEGIPDTFRFGRLEVDGFEAPPITRDRHGLLTNGLYRLDSRAMTKHTSGSLATGDSQFFHRVNTDQLTLDAAAYANAAGLWDEFNKARVVLSRPIGVHGRSGIPTSVINLYRNDRGLVHASPGTP